MLELSKPFIFTQLGFYTMTALKEFFLCFGYDRYEG